jgi:hypothetical protein
MRRKLPDLPFLTVRARSVRDGFERRPIAQR